MQVYVAGVEYDGDERKTRWQQQRLQQHCSVARAQTAAPFMVRQTNTLDDNGRSQGYGYVRGSLQLLTSLMLVKRMDGKGLSRQHLVLQNARRTPQLKG